MREQGCSIGSPNRLGGGPALAPARPGAAGARHSAHAVCLVRAPLKKQAPPRSKAIPSLVAGGDAPPALKAMLAEAAAADDATRQWALADGLTRECTPAWLRAAGLPDAAAALAGLQPITAAGQAEAAGGAI